MSTTEKRLISLKESDALRAMPGLNPQALIAAAVDKGAPIETLERLVQLAKDVRQITARELYFEAMATFKRECPRIKKDATANAGQYSYNYATLDGILDVVDPVLGKVGLTVSWRQKHEGQAVHASCVITHQMGHQEESGYVAVPFEAAGRMNPAQRVGSAATYAKRYSLLAILGLAPEDDDDARSTGDSKPTRPAKTEPTSSHDWRQDPAEPREQPTEAELVEQSEVLFPDPEQDRLVQECGKIIKAALVAKTITQKDVRNMKATYLGAEDANPEKCDVAALTDLRKYLAARFEKGSAQ